MRVSIAFLFASVLAVGASAGPLPPLGAGQTYVVFPPGLCTGLIEVGVYKYEIGQYWTESPRKFYEPCSVLPFNTWPARYRLAVRCVDRVTKTAVSTWVRSNSALGRPWPAQCQQWVPGDPQTGTPPE